MGSVEGTWSAAERRCLWGEQGAGGGTSLLCESGRKLWREGSACERIERSVQFKEKSRLGIIRSSRLYARTKSDLELALLAGEVQCRAGKAGRSWSNNPNPELTIRGGQACGSLDYLQEPNAMSLTRLQPVNAGRKNTSASAKLRSSLWGVLHYHCHFAMSVSRTFNGWSSQRI
jgi:hypothetical protein